MSHKRCYRCSGMKSYMGLGMIKHKCDVCHGIGYIKEEATKESSFVEPVECDSIPAKKRGRPKQ